MKDKKILLGLTTTSRSNWREKIKEIKFYNIQEIALFPTVLSPEERKKLYRLLEKSPIERISHVHLRNDMELWELDYFVEKYQTQVFNIHPEKSHPPFFDYSKYASRIYIENVKEIPTIEELKKCGGLCLDLTHWEKFSQLKGKEYNEKILKLIGRFQIGCCHISAIRNISCKIPFFKKLVLKNHTHFLKKLSDLDYIQKYFDYLPEIISIELENSFREQLKVKEYLEKIINNQG
jgi:hypothetical protein